MSTAQLGFMLLSSITVAGAFGAVTLRNVTYTLLSAVLFFVGIAGLFFMLRADFIGVVQILVYVGAIAVLIVFAIVLTRSAEGDDDRRGGLSLFVGALVAILVGGALVAVILQVPASVGGTALPVGATKEVGESLMTTYVLPFEIASLLLTAALVGAVVIAIDDVKKRNR
jgi:NADH-quinone oxidoreductase subunit J